MAAAAAAAARQIIMRPAHAMLGSNDHGHDEHSGDEPQSRSPKGAEDRPQQAREQEERKERESVAQSNTTEPLAPKEIAQDPQRKDLGKSSGALRIQDFDLVKTLGTGTAGMLLKCLQS